MQKRLTNNKLKKTKKENLIELLKSLYNELNEDNKPKLTKTVVEAQNEGKDVIIDAIEWMYDLISEQTQDVLVSTKAPIETKTKKITLKSKKDNGTEEPDNYMPRRVPIRKPGQPLPESDVVKLVGYRYTYPQFPKQYHNATVGAEIHARGDIKTIQDIAKALTLAEEQGNRLIVCAWVNKLDIRDNYLYDDLGVHEEPITKVLEPWGGSFPDDLDIQEIAYIDEEHGRVFTTISYYTGVPFTYTRRGFENCEELNCRASRFDYQIYEVLNNKNSL